LFPPTEENKSSKELATLVDIVPTLCDLLNITPPADARGVSLLPVFDGKSVQDEILFTFDDTKSGSSGLPSSVKNCNRLRTIRTKEWKYTRYFDALGSYEPQYELYNLIQDENEYTNLAYNPDYADRVAKMDKKLKKLERKKLLINGNTFTSYNWVDTNPMYDNFVSKPELPIK
jgi:arylsulfatase A-like enzyme